MKKIPPFLRTKYAVATFALLFWITFLHNNDLISQVSSRVKLQLLKNEQQYYRGEIEKTKEAIHDLTTNVESLEKFAREHHHMKKENEDLYLVITEEK
jgi:cell division protein FtsB